MSTARKKPASPADVMKPMPKAMGAEMLSTEEAAASCVKIERETNDRFLAPVPEHHSPPVVQLPVEAPQVPAQAAPVPIPPDIPSLMAAAQEAHGKGDLSRAEMLYRSVLDMNWAEPEVLRRIGEVCLSQGRHTDALPSMLRAIALHSHDARTLAQAGVCYSFMGEMPQAKHYYDRAIAVSPNFPLARWNRSLWLLWNGEYREGWKDYRWGTLLGVRPNRHILPQWDGKPVAGYPARGILGGKFTKYTDTTVAYTAKTLYIWAEQGFGDGLMFLRFTKGLKAKYGFSRIVLEVQAPLLPLLWDYDKEDIDLIVGAQIDGGFVEEFDEHISLAELPQVLGIDSVDAIPSEPYLPLPVNPMAQQLLAGWRQAKKAEGKYLVGICWKGNPGHVNDKARSAGIERFAELASIPGVQLVPLVPGEKPDCCPEAFDLADFEKTAQVIAALDLVITVDTAVGHLAGALGKECWLLSPKAADWRWHPVPGKPEKAVWYDAIRLYRQAVQGEWAELFDRVKADLTARATPAPIPLLGPGDPAWAETEK